MTINLSNTRCGRFRSFAHISKWTRSAITACRSKPGKRAAFTLLELLVAVSVFAIVLAAVNAVFYSALRLRNRSAAMIDQAVPIEHALTIIRRDMLNIVPPGTNLFGPLQSTSSSNLVPTASGPAFYCANGILDEINPWGDIQRISYGLVDSTNRFRGMDLVRYVDRNLLAVTPDAPAPQLLLSGVRSILFSFYDGSQWREYWDSSTEETPLPLGVKVEIQLEPDRADPQAALPDPLQLIIPIMVSGFTNSTAEVTPF